MRGWLRNQSQAPRRSAEGAAGGPATDGARWHRAKMNQRKRLAALRALVWTPATRPAALKLAEAGALPRSVVLPLAGAELEGVVAQGYLGLLKEAASSQQGARVPPRALVDALEAGHFATAHFVMEALPVPAQGLVDYLFPESLMWSNEVLRGFLLAARTLCWLEKHTEFLGHVRRSPRSSGVYCPAVTAFCSFLFWHRHFDREVAAWFDRAFDFVWLPAAGSPLNAPALEWLIAAGRLKVDDRLWRFYVIQLMWSLQASAENEEKARRVAALLEALGEAAQPLSFLRSMTETLVQAGEPQGALPSRCRRENYLEPADLFELLLVCVREGRLAPAVVSGVVAAGARKQAEAACFIPQQAGEKVVAAFPNLVPVLRRAMEKL